VSGEPPDPPEAEASPVSEPPVDPQEESFYAAALSRILRTLLITTLLLTPLIILRFGVIAAAGFAAGGFVSWLNFRSLVSGAQGLAERIVNQHSSERGSVVISRFLLRYVLVGVIAYGIFKGSPVAFRGFLWGLTVPVAGMLVEAGYEAFIAFRRSN
jgi:ATP synthase I chain